MRAPTTVERAAQVAYNLMCQSTTCSALLGKPYGGGTVYPMYNGGPYLDANGQVVLEADGSSNGGTASAGLEAAAPWWLFALGAGVAWFLLARGGRR